MNIVEAERDKYTQIWDEVPEYRDYSPGLENFPRFMSIVQPKSNETLIDLGCGTGEGGLAFREMGLDVAWLDITDAGLHVCVPREKFTQATLWAMPRKSFNYGFCCDVMEHIPPEFTMLVLDRITTMCRVSWFSISFLPDEFGKAIDQTLHLTVQPFNWWLDRLRMFGIVTEARDLCGVGVFVVMGKQRWIN